MSVAVIRADARSLPLPDASVDLIVTSPPYFGLRSYTDGCPACAETARAGNRGYMERYCPGCGKIRNRNVCPECGLTTLRTEATKAANRKTDCPDCGGSGQRHYAGQIGSEATPREYVAALLECTREWVRVLKPSGSMFINLGDKYSGGGSGENGMGKSSLNGHGGAGTQRDRVGLGRSRAVPGALPKSLLGLPWQYALACMDDLGLILRAEIIWAKPNGLPESVTDRVRRSHEQVFHFTRQPRYYSAVDEVREPHAQRTYDQHRVDVRAGLGMSVSGHRNAPGDGRRERSSTPEPNPLGKLPGSVWEIPSQPLTVPARLGTDHFAAFPMELPRRAILGWSPPGICTACGEGRRPVRQYEADEAGYFGEPIEERRREPSPQQAQQIRQLLTRCREQSGLSRADVSERVVGSRSGACWNWESGLRIPDPAHWRALKRVLGLPDDWDHLMLDTVMRPSVNGKFLGGIDRHVSAATAKSQRSPGKTITGYACACPQPDAPTRPAVVADPFGGTGTTALVADALGRHGLSFDRSADYGRLAKWRTTDPGERAKALQVPKPPPIIDGQDALFAL